MSELLTPGYSWSEGRPFYEGALDVNFQRLSHVNLRERYPLPVNAEDMQRIWDCRKVETIESKGGARLTTVELNSTAEEGTVVWLPGWGVSNLRDGGSRVAVAIAVLNPNHRILLAEEIDQPTVGSVIAASEGDLLPYAKHYIPLFDRIRGPYVGGGHSKGALVHALLAAHGDTVPDALTITDGPSYKRVASVMKFAFDVGIRDNRVQTKYMNKPHQIDANSETLLESLSTNTADEKDTPLEALRRAKSEWYLIRGMSHMIMPKALSKIAKQQDTPLFIWHGTENVGSPVDSVRQTVHGLQTNFPDSDIRYFESKTGHYAVGHTAKHGRQVAFMLDQIRTT